MSKASSMGSMQPIASPDSYTSVAKLLHWTILVLLVMQYSIALALPLVLPKNAEDALNSWHFSVGSTILFVMLLRLLWRLTHRPPPPPRDLPPVLQAVSRTTHWLMYALLIVLPILGWTTASALDAQVNLFGLIPLPALVAPDKAFADRIGSVHITVALTLAAVIALHITGALYHALVKRDDVVRRILPS